MGYRIHILSVPNTKTLNDGEWLPCAFTQKVWKFCKAMKGRGHHLIHYGVEGGWPSCQENVAVASAETFERCYGKRDKRGLFLTNKDSACYKEFHANAIAEIAKRKEEGDILLNFWGRGNQPVIDAHSDMITIHGGIGYYTPDEEGHKWRVFESNALRAVYYGRYDIMQARGTDVVIPNYFDVDDFEYRDDKEDWYLYCGRVGDYKGVDNAIKATQLAGRKLVVAGQLSNQYAEPGYRWPKHVEYVGVADRAMRKELMAKARGMFLLTKYLEPFGGAQVEAMLSGTPVITTNHSCFPEINKHGLTGYCCDTLDDVLGAMARIEEGWIKPYWCRIEGLKYDMHKVVPKYEDLFARASG